MTTKYIRAKVKMPYGKYRFIWATKKVLKNGYILLYTYKKDGEEKNELLLTKMGDGDIVWEKEAVMNKYYGEFMLKKESDKVDAKFEAMEKQYAKQRGQNKELVRRAK